MRQTNRVAGGIVLTLLIMTLPASSFGASAKRLGRPISAYSASLFGQKNLTAMQTQTLACDPDEPLFGSTSVGYDPGVVRLTGFGYGPGYESPPTEGLFFTPFPSGAGIELVSDGAAFMRDLNQYLFNDPNPNERETGYVQVFWRLDDANDVGHYIPPDEDFLGFNSAFVDGVDTHFLNFEYRAGVPDEIPASYRVFDSLGRNSGARSDVMGSGDPLNPEFTAPGEIVDAVIFGTAVPEPGTLALALAGGALAFLRRSRRHAC